jgi:histidine triad (HIT) family protein
LFFQNSRLLPDYFMPTCLFCQIQTFKSSGALQFEDAHCIVLEDKDKQAPVHQLIIPKKHIATLNDVATEDANLIGHLFLIAQQRAQAAGIAESGYRTLFNCRAAGGQAIFHLHLHLLGGRQMRWPPG